MTPHHPVIFGIPIEFILFGLTLVCVAVFHQHTLRVALAGLFTVAVYKILFTGFKMGPGLVGFVSHVKQEWVILTNLLCLLLGFAVLVVPFREKPSDFGSAKVFASRLERRLGVAGRSMGSFELPGQYRRSADRWCAGT